MFESHLREIIRLANLELDELGKLEESQQRVEKNSLLPLCEATLYKLISNAQLLLEKYIDLRREFPQTLAN